MQRVDRAGIPGAGVYHVRTSLSRIMNFTGYFPLLLYIPDGSQLPLMSRFHGRSS
jgi:hypothetical protein